MSVSSFPCRVRGTGCHRTALLISKLRSDKDYTLLFTGGVRWAWMDSTLHCRQILTKTSTFLNSRSSSLTISVNLPAS